MNELLVVISCIQLHGSLQFIPGMNHYRACHSRFNFNTTNPILLPVRVDHHHNNLVWSSRSPFTRLQLEFKLLRMLDILMFAMILLYCRYLVQNMDWLEQVLGDADDDYVLFDCPGKLMLSGYGEAS